MVIESLTPDDKEFLDEFTKLECLAMNQTHLKSTKNFPDAPTLVRVSIFYNDNINPLIVGVER